MHPDILLSTLILSYSQSVGEGVWPLLQNLSQSDGSKLVTPEIDELFYSLARAIQLPSLFCFHQWLSPCQR